MLSIREVERSRMPASGVRATQRAARRAIAAFALLAAAPLAAQDGSYDPSFGTGGRVWSDTSYLFADEASVMRTLADGTLFVAGTCKANSSYNPGQACALWLDAHGNEALGYGPGGGAHVSFDVLPGWPATQSRLVDAQPLADGRIAALCAVDDEARWVLAVLKKDGTGFDASVGNGGIVTLLDGPAGSGPIKNGLYGMVLQRDGRLVAAGYRKQSDGDYDMLALRLTANSFTLDPGFGSGGVATVDLTPYDEAHAVAVQPDGKIVLAGSAYPQAAIVRLTATGAPDATFGSAHDGRYLNTFGSSSASLWGIAVDAQGRAVFGGRVGEYGQSDGLVGRLLPSGTLDPDFQWHVFPSWSGPWPLVFGVLVQSDGKVLAGGTRARSPDSTSNYFAVMRFNPDGSFDSSFGDGGYSYGDLSPQSDSVNDMPVSIALTNGGLMIAGTTSVASGEERFALTKLRIDLVFADGFER